VASGSGEIVSEIFVDLTIYIFNYRSGVVKLSMTIVLNELIEKYQMKIRELYTCNVTVIGSFEVDAKKWNRNKA
jgi:hypothetical protein